MEEKSIKISVIIPMFNTDEYVQETIESLLAQTFQDFELILVDDASTDKTYEIASFFASRHNQIVLYKQEKNKGVSAARNIGLELARGKYIFFVDSDDTLPEETLEKMYLAAINNHADIVTGIYERFDKKNSVISNFFNIYPELKIEGTINLYECPGILYSVYSCGKLFKREVILQAKFLEVINYGEDHIFTIEAFLKAHHIYNLASTVYNYRIRDGETESLSQSVYKDPVNNLEYLLEILRIIEKMLVKYVSEPQLRAKLFSIYLSRVLHWNIWTALSHGLLSMNMSTRFKVLSLYISWFDGLTPEVYEANLSDFNVINYKIDRVKSVLDTQTIELCDRLLYK
ncbi:glycosyltransferase family 2 protein [Paenibacillus medicaginis]|uniref:Glycosyltransferase family 2 protein n=1 Tax=Paenibacillus medicaginis TaxID=1470560 RepID=A0ABV5BX55_9BACL